jgi:Animal haem peroxidase
MANFNTSDLEFILTQIKMAETGTPPLSPHLAFGLREVAGTNNSAVTAQGTFGSADQTFPTATQQYFQTVTVNVDGTPFDPNPGVAGDVQTTTYASTIPGAPQAFGVNVIDPGPRLISNAISDISINNPAAVQTAQAFGAQLGDGYTVMNTNPSGLTLTLGVDGIAGTADDFWGADGVANTTDDVNTANLFIGNITPDAGLSAPFNNWLTFFGQFFDHGVDLITKGGNGTVFIPLAADDPLRTVGPDGIVDGSVRPDGTIAPNDVVPASQAFMILTRATNLPGADGILGTADDLHQNTNTITPFVDQSQTYTSNPAHQAFLREYITGVDGKLHSTGKLLQHAAGPDNIAGNADDNTGMATWSDVKANALKLGIVLTDYNVGNVPLVATDAYGNLLLSANGNVQIVVSAAGGGQALVEAGNINAANGPITAIALPANTIFTDHAFLNDTAFMAVPFKQDGVTHLVADTDAIAGNAQPINPLSGEKLTYDNELLDAHYIQSSMMSTIVCSIRQRVSFNKNCRMATSRLRTIGYWPASILPSPMASMPTACRSTSFKTTNGTASACSKPPSSAPRRSISILCSKNLPAKLRQPSTSSVTSISTSTQRSSPNLPTRCIALATRCSMRTYRHSSSMLMARMQSAPMASPSSPTWASFRLSPIRSHLPPAAQPKRRRLSKAQPTRLARKSTSSSPVRCATIFWACRLISQR